MSVEASVRAPTGMRHVVVFACGDPFRGDDSVGRQAVAGLDRAAIAAADVRSIGALEPEHLVDLGPETAIVIVDAVVGPPPGRVIDLGLAEVVERSAVAVTTSSHQLPLDRVVALAQVLRDEPLDGRFVGVGIEAVHVGDGLSEAVRWAMPRLRAAVVAAVRDLASSTHETLTA